MGGPVNGVNWPGNRVLAGADSVWAADLRGSRKARKGAKNTKGLTGEFPESAQRRKENVDLRNSPMSFRRERGEAENAEKHGLTGEFPETRAAVIASGCAEQPL